VCTSFPLISCVAIIDNKKNDNGTLKIPYFAAINKEVPLPPKEEKKSESESKSSTSYQHVTKKPKLSK
jgi:hypothetical protein